MNIGEFNDYTTVLRHWINTHQGVRGYHGLLAKAAGCQQSYLSRVLKGEVHLTPEHAVGLAGFWELSPLKTDFFLSLVNLGRAGTPALKKYCQSQINALRKKLSEVPTQFSAQLAETREIAYYSSWHMAALHVLCSIGSLSKSELLARHLGLSEEFVQAQLSQLENIGIVKREGKTWRPVPAHLHAPAGSIFHWLHLSNWRQRALHEAQKKDERSLHYTGIHSLSRSDAQRLRFELLKFVRESAAIVAASPEEQGLCVNIDFFEI